VVTYPGSPYAFGLVAHGVQNEITLYIAPIDSVGKPDTPWRKVCDVEDEVADFTPRGDQIYLLTHKDASRFKVVRTSLTDPDPAHAEVIVPPGDAVIQGISLARDALYVQVLDGGVGRLLRVPFAGPGVGTPERVALPFDGAVWVAAADRRLSGIFLGLTSAAAASTGRTGTWPASC